MRVGARAMPLIALRVARDRPGSQKAWRAAAWGAYRLGVRGGAFPADTANRDRRQSGSCRVTRGTLSQSGGLRPAVTLTWRVAAAKPGEDAVRASSPGSTLPCT